MMRQSPSAARLDLLEGALCAESAGGAEDAQRLLSSTGGGGSGGDGADPSHQHLQPSFRGGNFCPTGTGQLTHYNLSGPSNGRLAVCVHGMTLASYTFTDMGRALAHAGFRVLRFDLFGRGLSSGPPPNAPCSSKTYVAQLELLLQGLELWPDACHDGLLIGASLGGAVAAAFCAAHRDLFRQLVLIAPVGLPHFRLPAFARVLDLAVVGRPLAWLLSTCCARVLRSYVVDMFQGSRWHDAVRDDVSHTNNSFVTAYMQTLRRFEWTTMKHGAFQRLGENTVRLFVFLVCLFRFGFGLVFRLPLPWRAVVGVVMRW
jgi:pimeloyl-ACP methyl ester carboxylesterase